MEPSVDELWTGQDLVELLLKNSIEDHVPRRTTDQLPMRKEGNVMVVQLTERLPSVLKKLAHENFLSAPVLDGDRYVGFVDMIDLVKFIMGLFEGDSEEAWIDFWGKSNRFREATVEDVLELPNKWRRDLHPPTLGRYSSLHALEQMVHSGLRRMAVVSPETHRVKGIITQSMLISFLRQNRNKIGGFLNTVVQDMEDLPNRVETVLETDKAVNAFSKMAEKRISGLGIVNQDGVLVGSISVRDLRGVGANGENFFRLFRQVKEFKKWSMEAYPHQSQRGQTVTGQHLPMAATIAPPQKQPEEATTQQKEQEREKPSLKERLMEKIGLTGPSTSKVSSEIASTSPSSETSTLTSTSTMTSKPWITSVSEFIGVGEGPAGCEQQETQEGQQSSTSLVRFMLPSFLQQQQQQQPQEQQPQEQQPQEQQPQEQQPQEQQLAKSQSQSILPSMLGSSAFKDMTPGATAHTLDSARPATLPPQAISPEKGPASDTFQSGDGGLQRKESEVQRKPASLPSGDIEGNFSQPFQRERDQGQRSWAEKVQADQRLEREGKQVIGREQAPYGQPGWEPWGGQSWKQDWRGQGWGWGRGHRSIPEQELRQGIPSDLGAAGLGAKGHGSLGEKGGSLGFRSGSLAPEERFEPQPEGSRKEQTWEIPVTKGGQPGQGTTQGRRIRIE